MRPSHQFSITPILVVIILLLNPTIFSVERTSNVDNGDAISLQPVTYLFYPFVQYFKSGTNRINLQFIEKYAQTTPEQVDNAPNEAQIDPGTPTPTPIPVQRGSTNLPIVLGAIAIISVIILAWLFVGFLPKRTRE